ncbi:MAG: hypothetical protein IJU00_01810 [Selenomonas sp.]|nr:hypothetical protein [Selenomonas sp.]
MGLGINVIYCIMDLRGISVGIKPGEIREEGTKQEKIWAMKKKSVDINVL